MKTKYVNNLLNVIIAIALVITSIYTWRYLDTFSAPEYEVVNLDLKFPYEFTSEDGQKIKSSYVPAWHNGTPVAYDSIYKRSTSFSEEYLNEITEKMPPSEYSFWARHALWWIIVCIGIVVIVICLFGIVVKEFLLAIYASVTGNFLDAAYFFKEKRWAGNAIAHKAFKNTVNEYVSRKRSDIERHYQNQNARMLIEMLDYIRYTGSPRIPYLLTMTNKTKNQFAYIGQLINYWEQQIGKDPKAEGNINYLRELRTRNYAEYTIFTKDEDIHNTVSLQLDKIFERLMGEPVFSFEAYVRHFMPELKVDIELTNSLTTFTIDSEGDKRFPGIDIIITISRKSNVIWHQLLSPKCNYTVEEGSFVASDMYETMIKQTIMTLSDKVQ